MVPPKIVILNGVNLDLLGTREPEYYGHENLEDLVKILKAQKNYELQFYQTNSEAEFLSYLSMPWDGALINAGAWTHSSLAISDRLAAVKRPFVEVHLSNIYARETERHRSYLAAHALGVISGFGITSYVLGLSAILAHLEKQEQGSARS